jgi:hypothetical protein
MTDVYERTRPSCVYVHDHRVYTCMTVIAFVFFRQEILIQKCFDFVQNSCHNKKINDSYNLKINTVYTKEIMTLPGIAGAYVG